MSALAGRTVLVVEAEPLVALDDFRESRRARVIALEHATMSCGVAAA
jgi:hypothetical protein